MLRYRPFLDGPHRLAMGVRGLDLVDWIEIDDDHRDQMAERRALLDRRHADVFQALPESGPGQEEVLELLLAHLPARFPERYSVGAGAISNRISGERFGLDPPSLAPLEVAGRLVQEDLCLLTPSDAGYRLTAAVLCFPAHWRLADKLGRPLLDIHAPVPEFAERLGRPVDRLFATLQVERPIWRVNWSLVDTPKLFLPPEHRRERAAVVAEHAGEQLWLRVERQTLRRLPRSGDVLFTIRTYVEPLGAALDAPAAHALAARIREMPPATAQYKGIEPIRAPLLAYLDQRARFF